MKKKLGIMQPYFFPYIGYWQLMAAVDQYVVYDNIQFSKQGWIRRNRILFEGQDKLISLPLKKDSDYLDICDRYLADSFCVEKKRILALVAHSYQKAPLFAEAYPVIEKILNYENNNLFQYIYSSIREIRDYIGIDTPLIVSSTIDMNHTLRGKDRVLEICRKMGAHTYINAIGGQKLYAKEYFAERGMELYFLQTGDIRYRQFGSEFVPNLSIIDVMMFNSREQIREMLREYVLV